MGRLICNKVMCLKCKDIIESKHRHDFKYCSCGAIFVDGGLDYQRVGWDNGRLEDCIKDLSEYKEEETHLDI